MKRTLINYLGLLGMVSLLSYTAAVIFSPLAYPDYHWLSQAVSDLSAEAASSRTLWNQLSALYMPCGIVCCTVNCIAVAGKYNKMLRLGVYLFALMNWVTAVGYAMFPLTDAGTPNGFQNIMHLVVTGAVVALSILALVLNDMRRLFSKAVPEPWLLGRRSAILDDIGRSGCKSTSTCIFRLGREVQHLCGGWIQCRAGHLPLQRFFLKTTRRTHDGNSN